MSSWSCMEPGCDEGGEGPNAEVDRAAARHTEKPPKHPTSTSYRGRPATTKESR